MKKIKIVFRDKFIFPPLLINDKSIFKLFDKYLGSLIGYENFLTN